MTLKKFFIVLDKPEGVYFPGQTVTGKVRVSIVDKPTKNIENISLECRGYSNVDFKLGNTSYTASEKYFTITVPIRSSNST